MNKAEFEKLNFLSNILETVRKKGVRNMKQSLNPDISDDACIEDIVDEIGKIHILTAEEVREKIKEAGG